MQKMTSTTRLTMKRAMGGVRRKETSHGVTNAVKIRANAVTPSHDVISFDARGSMMYQGMLASARRTRAMMTESSMAVLPHAARSGQQSHACESHVSVLHTCVLHRSAPAHAHAHACIACEENATDAVPGDLMHAAHILHLTSGIFHLMHVHLTLRPCCP